VAKLALLIGPCSKRSQMAGLFIYVLLPHSVSNDFSALPEPAVKKAANVTVCGSCRAIPSSEAPSNSLAVFSEPFVLLPPPAERHFCRCMFIRRAPGGPLGFFLFHPVNLRMPVPFFSPPCTDCFQSHVLIFCAVSLGLPPP